MGIKRYLDGVRLLMSADHIRGKIDDHKRTDQRSIQR